MSTLSVFTQADGEARMQNKHWDYEENELEVAGEVDLYIPWNKTKAVGTYVATGW